MSVGKDNWLFRQGELILGPVPSDQIVEKLFSGELDGKTEISPMGQHAFRRLADLDAFRVHLAKAEAKHRVDAAERELARKRAKVRNIAVGGVAVVALLVALAAAMGARYLAIHNPWKEVEDLYELSISAPTITLAKARATEEELVAYPGVGSAASRGGGQRKGPAQVARAKSAAKAGRLSDPTGDPDGMQTAEFDQDAINQVVATKQKTLYPCIVEEVKKRPAGQGPAKIPIEFVIGNDGRVAKVWVDHPSYKNGSMQDCLLRELQKWPFKPYEGERATVGLSFNIGRSG